MRKLLTAFLLLTIPLGSACAGTLTVPTPECNAIFHHEADGDRVTGPNLANIASPGDPALPYADICVLVPPDADPASISAQPTGVVTRTVPGTHDIAPAPPMVTVVDGKPVSDWGPGKQIESGRNMLVYGNDEFYPSANVEVIEVGNLRAWRIARVRYYPYRFNPVTGELTLTSGGDIAVSFTQPRAKSSSTAAVATPDPTFNDKVRKLVANFDKARRWYEPTSPSFGALDISSEPPRSRYVILTTSAIASASSKLQLFAAHKAGRGFDVGIVTETQWGGGTGDPAANRIRAYLASHYLADNIRYVLLIGDPTPSTGTVPMKMLWPRNNLETYREAPSDYFYADLTGNWDRDGDNYYGEQDNDFGTGGVDRFPEVIVGRIPFYGSLSDLDSILQKIINYEAGIIGGAWVRNVLLSAKPSDANTPGYHLCEAIKSDAAQPVGFSDTRVYEQTYALDPPPDYTPCTYANVLAAWQRAAGFHFWWTHGSETTASEVFTSSMTAYLDDQYPSFTFQVSCLNAYPENSQNLGYALLKRGAIATDSATRVSWYYPGQTIFTNSDSNAGMAYTYAIKLVRDHMPCGDAHFEMMTQVPNYIWMNHCVFNLYGDPSLTYVTGPSITHTPLPDTDATSGSYAVEADITVSGTLSGSPAVRWNTDGGSVFNTALMNLVDGSTYRGFIPAQPYGTNVRYYIYASDSLGRYATSPAGAPVALHSFQVRLDDSPPTIQHTPLPDTGDRTGPYVVRATITDDLGLGSVMLYYNRNGGPDAALPMILTAGVHEAQIPGPADPGDVISYYILAVDVSVARKTTRSPVTGYHSFAISGRANVAVYNCSTAPSYFTGGAGNIHSQVTDILSTDPLQRFQVSVVTSLTSNDLVGKDALVLPDNGVQAADLNAVSSWFGPGKVIVALDSAVCYAAYAGWMWPAAAGTNGYGVYWDYNSDPYQQIWRSHVITSGYFVGQVIEARMFETEYFVNKLPSDATALAGKQSDPSRAYAAFRDVPNRGRIVVLGPYVGVCSTQYGMLRNAVVPPPLEKGIRITAPAGGETYEAGQTISVSWETLGTWSAVDRVSLEYYTGLDSVWRQIPGADALVYTARTFQWNTAGCRGGHNYRVRASLVGAGVSDESDLPFTIVRTVRIDEAKSALDGEVVKLDSKVVTCSIGSWHYVQEPDRLAGIRLVTGSGFALSTVVDATGVVATVNGERLINAETTSTLGSAPAVAPFAMNTRSLGGGQFGLQPALMEYRFVKTGETWTLQFLPMRGLSNIGLLVRIWGRVTYVGSDHIYVDDGGRCDDGSGRLGVKVLCSGFSKPSLGQKVIVTGVSSLYFDRGSPFRALVLPSQSSLRVLP